MSTAVHGPRSTVHGATLILFWAFTASVVFSLAGMFALQLAPSIGARVGTLLPLLMSAPTWVYVVTLPLAALAMSGPLLGWGRALAFAALGTAIGAAAELLGTATGFPFGAYSYSDFLGPKIAGRVPWAIPPSWYAAGFLSFALASALGLTHWRRVVVAAAYMVLWDVALDPAMSAGFPVWIWAEQGPFYGMPWINWAGWFGTALIIETLFELGWRARALEAGAWPARLWLVNGAFAVGICLNARLWLAVGVGAAAIAIPIVLARFAAARRPEPPQELGINDYELGG